MEWGGRDIAPILSLELETFLCFCSPLALLSLPWEEHIQASLLVQGGKYKTLSAEAPNWAQAIWAEPQPAHGHMSYNCLVLGTTDIMFLFVKQQCKWIHDLLLSQLCSNQSPGWMVMHMTLSTFWAGQNDQSRHPCVKARTPTLHPSVDSRGERRVSVLQSELDECQALFFPLPMHCLI